MATGWKLQAKVLRLNTNRKDSGSYLLSPELSPSPSHFSTLPPYSYAHENSPSNMPQGRDFNVGSQGSMIQDVSVGSMAPLIPNSRPSRDQWTMPRNQGVFQNNLTFGVGDLEHIHIDGSQPKTYDYADYGHQYEELPNRNSIAKRPYDSQMDSRSELYPSSGSGSTSASGNMSNNVSNMSEKRKRVNPLYDTNTQSMPSIYSKSTKEDSNRALNKQIRCLKCALIVFVVLTFAALAVSVFAVISHMQTKDQADPVLTPQVAKLSDNYSRLEQLLASFEGKNDTMQALSDLIQKVSYIERNMTADISDLRTKAELNSENTQQNADRILGTHANISDVISQLNTTLQLQLHTITKMEGPRGPQGVANFSQCLYDDVTDDSVASDINSSYTPWLLTRTKLETNIVLFATCMVDGGLTAMLEVNKPSPDRVQYRCRCSGKVIDKARRLCTIHILSCPRYS